MLSTELKASLDTANHLAQIHANGPGDLDTTAMFHIQRAILACLEKLIEEQDARGASAIMGCPACDGKLKLVPDGKDWLAYECTSSKCGFKARAYLNSREVPDLVKEILRLQSLGDTNG